MITENNHIDCGYMRLLNDEMCKKENKLHIESQKSCECISEKKLTPATRRKTKLYEEKCEYE